MTGITIIAHRGCGPTNAMGGPGKVLPDNFVPENTLKAFREAVAQGADGIEFDLQVTKDGHLVVIHDDKLNENVEGAARDGKELGNVSDHTLVELKVYNVGQGERIPSFRETLDYFAEVSAERVRQGLAPLIIHAELKGKRTEEFVAPVVKEYVEQGKLRLEDFVFGSFRHDEIKALKEAEPDFPVSIYLRTKMLFGESNIVMPGWHVKEGADYDPVCLEYLRNMRRATGVVAFDPVLWDIYEPLVQVAKEEGAEMHISTSDIRVFDHDHLVTVLAIARSGVKTSFKTDEPALVRKALEELDATYNAAFSSPIQNVTHAEVIGDDKRGSFASAAAETISWVRRTLSRPIHPRPQGYIASMASEPAPGAGK